jgi:signal peptidase II
MTAMTMTGNNPARLGWAVALIALALDQLSKFWILNGLQLTEGGGAVALLPFAELRLVWNHGISYGLFQQHSDIGRWLLIAVSVAATIGLAIWLSRTTHVLIALAVGLIMSGAIGNAIDRTIFGGVADFIHLYLPDHSHDWYVFNLADAAIVAGVIGLLYDSVFRTGQR